MEPSAFSTSGLGHGALTTTGGYLPRAERNAHDPPAVTVAPTTIDHDTCLPSKRTAPAFSIGRVLLRGDGIDASPNDDAVHASTIEERPARCDKRSDAAASTFGRGPSRTAMVPEAGVNSGGYMLSAEESDVLKPAIRGGCFGTGPGTQRAAPPVDERSALDPNVDAIKPRAAAVAFGPPPSELSTDAHRAPWPVAEAPPAPGPGTYDVPAPELVYRRSPAVAMAAPTTAERAAAEARKAAANKELAAKAAAAEAAALAEREADAAAAAARAAELAHRAPFLSSAPRESGTRVTPGTAPAPLGLDALDAVAKVVRRAVPAFSFGAPPPSGARDGARDGTDASPGTAPGDAPGTALPGPGAYAPSLELVTKRAPAASFGIGARFVTSSSSDGADCVAGMGDEPTTAPPMTPPRSHGGYNDSSSLSHRGGAIGRAPRFGTAKDAKDGVGAGSSVPFSPTASTVLSDAATDIAPLDEVSRAAAAVRPRAPTALMAPERTAPKHSTKLREEQRQARLGPGRYS